MLGKKGYVVVVVVVELTHNNIRHKSRNEEEDHHKNSFDEEDDGELALMMRKFTRLNDKINKKGFNFDPKRRMFRPWGDVKNKNCYNCGEKGHIAPNCPKPDKRKKDNKSKHRHDSSDDDEGEKKNKNKKFGKKKRHDKKTKLFPKKKGNTK